MLSKVINNCRKLPKRRAIQYTLDRVHKSSTNAIYAHDIANAQLDINTKVVNTHVHWSKTSTLLTKPDFLIERDILKDFDEIVKLGAPYNIAKGSVVDRKLNDINDEITLRPSEREAQPIVESVDGHSSDFFELITESNTEKMIRRQTIIEEEQISLAVKEYTDMVQQLVKMGRGTSLKNVQAVLLNMYEPMVKAITEEIEKVNAGLPGTDRRTYGAFLLLVPVEKLAVITIDCALRNTLRERTTGVTVQTVALQISDIVETEFNIIRVKSKSRSDQLGPNLTPTEKYLAANPDLPRRQRAEIKAVLKRLRSISKESEWQKTDRVKLGCALLYLLERSALMDSGEPIFSRYTPLRRQSMLRLHPEVARVLGDGRDVKHITPRFLPMIVKPRRWSSERFFGAYIHLKAPLMKLYSSNYQMEAVKQSSMPLVLEGLHYLGCVPWVVDEAIFHLCRDAARRGEAVAEIPSSKELPMPDRSSCFRPASVVLAYREMRRGPYRAKAAGQAEQAAERKQMKNRAKKAAVAALQDFEGVLDEAAILQESITKEIQFLEQKQDLKKQGQSVDDFLSSLPPDTMVFDELYYSDQCRRAAKFNSEQHSLRCDLNIKLDIAAKFLKETLYFPHNMDFRGRAYPVPPNLCHLGSDLNRGILRFEKKKPLGQNGLRWLKIHLANLCGHNKVGFEERAQWVDERLDDVTDSARNPLGGRRWWLQQENPFQALSTCREIVAALDSGNPATFMSNLPVHQDGSCNGLQHYAALGRDRDGGEAVNLVPSAQPQDVYSRVLELVMAQLDEDAALLDRPSATVAGAEGQDDGLPLKERKKAEAARLIRPVVNRKVIKQTVMTSVYGVTLIGAREQILNRLKERFSESLAEGQLLDDELESRLYSAAVYLAKVTMLALSQIFTRAKEIMDWLATVSVLVSKRGQAMAWVTPLGLPVIQPYRKASRQQVRTVLLSVSLTLNEEFLPVYMRKQRTAFPPNFVHSLDASHMLLTALRMRDDNLTFAAVHDSFWTHACDVETMNIHLRDSFVDLYSFPVLEELRDSLLLRFPGVDFPPVPTRGKLDIAAVKDSTFFFH